MNGVIRHKKQNVLNVLNLEKKKKKELFFMIIPHDTDTIGRINFNYETKCIILYSFFY